MAAQNGFYRIVRLYSEYCRTLYGQPFLGSCVYEIGAGPKPIPVKNLSAENLLHAIIESEWSLIVEPLKRIGEKIRAEDGVAAAAVRRIESHVRSSLIF